MQHKAVLFCFVSIETKQSISIYGEIKWWRSLTKYSEHKLLQFRKKVPEVPPPLLSLNDRSRMTNSP